MSRIESGKLTIEETDVHLPDVIHDLKTIVQPSADAKQLELIVDMQDVRHEDIVADRLRLNQALLNILSNAIKFTPAGGTIRFWVIEKDPADDQTANFEFHIKDNGIGMSEEFQKVIFEAFTREKTSTVSGIQGTGLGMAITKKIVDMMGGTISVQSREGEGSEFVVALPCRISTGSAAPETPPAPERRDGQAQPLKNDRDGQPGRTNGPDAMPDFTGKRVLLAEDNEMNQMIAENILSSAGFQVDIAADGTESVEKVRNAPAGTYDLILMDIQMPKMDGHEAARQIRAMEDGRKAGIPIVAVTANVFEEDRKTALEAGMNGHLAKPYDIPTMMKTLQELLK
jgi:CheY-like chemotaxis protein